MNKYTKNSIKNCSRVRKEIIKYLMDNSPEILRKFSLQVGPRGSDFHFIDFCEAIGYTDFQKNCDRAYMTGASSSEVYMRLLEEYEKLYEYICKKTGKELEALVKMRSL